MLTIQDLLNPMTGDQIRAQFVSSLVTLGVPADKWVKGGVASTILTIIANSFASFQNLMVQAIGSGFLPTASGGWLTLLALNVFNVTRVTATFASGALTLTNAGGGLYTFSAGQATFQDSAIGKTYVNVAGFTLNPTSTLTIQITATEIGSGSNAIPGGVDTIVTSMLGVTCSNATAILGDDDESDASLRQRCVDKLGSLSIRGPRSAYSYAVRSALNAGVPVNINRVSVSLNPMTGVVNVAMAAPSGAPTTGDFRAAKENVELLARPDCITVFYFAASAIPYTAALRVFVQNVPGLTPADFTAAIQTALDAYFETYPIGGLPVFDNPIGSGVYATGIDGVVKTATVNGVPIPVFAVEGAVDLALTPFQVATNNVTISIVIITLST